MPSKLEECQRDLEELRRLLGTAERPRVKDVLLLEARRLETELGALREKERAAGDVEMKPATAAATASSKPRCYEVKLNNYAWNQSDKFVKIYVSLKNVHTLAEESVSCEFNDRFMHLYVKGLDNKNYYLPINNLLEEIDPEKSYWKVKTDNVVVFLAKKKVGTSWSHMTGSEKRAQDNKMPKLDSSEDPTAGLMDMMKHMYETGDDEMKRTIAKAWTESREKQMSGETLNF
ncbi:calcyclin-binding protein [Bacillus rossius redtenbacheri]|uniref:calcyclin-binding protein n=1 Tax=Bacillus rossius redtenbacheri TaxID=93214 RepID=UPI002FDEB1B8